MRLAENELRPIEEVATLAGPQREPGRTGICPRERPSIQPETRPHGYRGDVDGDRPEKLWLAGVLSGDGGLSRKVTLKGQRP